MFLFPYYTHNTEKGTILYGFYRNLTFLTSFIAGSEACVFHFFAALNIWINNGALVKKNENHYPFKAPGMAVPVTIPYF